MVCTRAPRHLQRVVVQENIDFEHIFDDGGEVNPIDPFDPLDPFDHFDPIDGDDDLMMMIIDDEDDFMEFLNE